MLYDFERKRLALNSAHRSLTYALMTTLKALRGRCGKGPEPDLPAPLPPEHVLVELRQFGVESARLGWRLVSTLVGKEEDLYWLSEENRLVAPVSKIELCFHPEGGLLGGPKAEWDFWLEGRTIEKLTYNIIRRSRVPVANHRELASFESRRRALEKARGKAAALFVRIRKLRDEACAESDRNLAEAAQVRVDEYGRPA